MQRLPEAAWFSPKTVFQKDTFRQMRKCRRLRSLGDTHWISDDKTFGSTLPAVQILGMRLTDYRAQSGRYGILEWVLFVVLLHITPHLYAQDPNNNYCLNRQGNPSGNFSVDNDRVCIGSIIKVSPPPANIQNFGYKYEYTGKGIPNDLTQALTYKYTQPGSYTIIQVGAGASLNQPTIFCKTIEVLPQGKVKFSARACGRTVTITPQLDATTDKYDYYQVNWSDPNGSTTIKQYSKAELTANIQYTYSRDGRYAIQIIGGYRGGLSCSIVSDPVSVVVGTTGTSVFINELTTVDDNTISVKFQAGTGAVVQLQQRDASGVYAPTSFTGISAGTFTVPTNAKQTQCFKLTSQDGCGNSGPESDQVCSLVLQVTPESKQNRLVWNAYQGTSTFRRYFLYKNKVPLGAIFDKNTTTRVDNNNIECGTNSCYFITAESGQTVVTSTSVCVTGIDNEKPPGFAKALVSIDNGKPAVIAVLSNTAPSSSYTMVVSRAPAGSSNFQPIGAIGTSTFTDAMVDASSGSYCYVVAYQNKCGQLSDPTSPVCTVWLDSKSAGGIDWTAASPFSGGAVSSYTLEFMDTGTGTGKLIPLGTSTHYEPDPNAPVVQTQQYRIIAVDQNGVVSYSNYYTLRIASKVFVPDAFTPNGDQANDVFLVRGTIGDTFRMTIFSRWGEVVYNTTDKTKGWDGLINGEPAMAGQYMYRIEVQDLEGTQTVKTGALLLLR